MHGRRTNDAETEFRWAIDEYRGEVLSLQIVDDSVARWGFISVRGLRLESLRAIDAR